MSGEALPGGIDAELARAPDDDARLAILLRALADHPDHSGLRWCLYNAYLAIGEHDAAQRQLVEGMRRGARDFVLEHARTYPESIGDERLAMLERESPVLVAGVFVARGRVDEARTCLEAYLRDGASAYRGGRREVGPWIDVMTVAAERGEWDLLVWMRAALREGRDGWHEPTDAAEDEASISERGRLDAVEELLAVHEDLPTGYPEALARGLRARSSRARGEAIHRLRLTSHDQARRVLRRLETDAPWLAQLFREALGGRSPDDRSARAPLRLRLAFALLTLLLLGLATCSALTPSERDPALRGRRALTRP
jgi:hypothetical protein